VWRGKVLVRFDRLIEATQKLNKPAVVPEIEL
jgi:hypothetical protein